MSINHIYGVEDDGQYLFMIDYSAQNSFGGYVRDTRYHVIKKTADGFSATNYVRNDGLGISREEELYHLAALSGYYEFDSVTFKKTSFIQES